MTAHTIRTVQKIPAPPEAVWSFFSNPYNLRQITPPAMGFRIISRHHGDTIYPGQLIEYQVRPLAGIPVYWMTEITHVRNGDYFIDEQRFGPYRLWHHQHHFKPIPGGVEMTDIVHYRIPWWLGGRLANGILVKKKLLDIFTYRYKKVESLFGQWENTSGKASEK